MAQPRDFATTNGAPRRRGRLGLWLIGALILLVALWCGYWYAATQVVAATAGRAVAALGARGQALSCSEQGMGGFPLRLDLRCVKPSFADERQEITAGLDGVSASAPLYWPGLVETKLTSPFVFNSPLLGIALTASWSAASSQAEVGLNGLSRASASIDSLNVERGDDSPRLPFISLTAAHADFAAGPAGGADYQVAVAAKDLSLVLRKNRILPNLTFDAQLAAIGFGSSLGTDPTETLKAWFAGGGELRIDDLNIMTGETSANAKGTLSLSRKGRLSGNVTVRIVGLESVPDLAAAFGKDARMRAEQVVGAMGLVTRQVEEGGRPALEMPILIRDGRVSVGIIPLGEIPPLRF